MEYWQVLKNGKLWTNDIESEDECLIHIEECVSSGMGKLEDFTYEKEI